MKICIFTYVFFLLQKIRAKTRLPYNISFSKREPNKKPGFLVGKPGCVGTIFVVIAFLLEPRFVPLFGADGPVTVRPSGGKRRKKYEKKTIL